MKLAVICFSAGVGRTGTFLTLDWSLEKAEAEGIVDVFALVKLLREYRVNMVQTLVSGSAWISEKKSLLRSISVDKDF